MKLKGFACAALALVLLLALLGCKDNKADAADKGLYVEYKGVKIVMGADADAIIEALGEPTEVREIGDCGGLGAQLKYSYSSVDVYVLEHKTDGNIIDTVTFRDDLVATPEGVYIGKTVESAKELLGEPDEQGDKSLQYKRDGFVLLIGIEDGKVTEIDYITPAE